MGKRSNFPRRARDFYATTAEGAAPLLPFLRRDGVTTFAEICVGQGDLKRHLEADGLRCVYEGDIVSGRDALGLTLADLNGGIPITNPPTKYPDENPRGSTCRLLCDLVQHFLDLGTPAWWFIHHDWVTTLRAVPFLAHCSDIVPAPRIKWIRIPRTATKDSFSWFRVDPEYRRSYSPIHHRGVPPPEPPGIACEACEIPFQPARSTARFCSDACRQRAHRAAPSAGPDGNVTRRQA